MRLVVLAVVLLAGCTDTSMNASIRAGSGGVSVSPTISGSAGAATVTVSP